MSKNTLIVAYASEGGNAKLLAEDFSKRCQLFDFQVSLICLNDLADQCFEKSPVICFVSTTGNGEFPLNGRNFYAQKASLENSLGGVEYALFALGSHSYSNFCGAGKKLNALFSEQQAQALVASVYADEDFHASYEVWALRLLSELSGLTEVELRAKMDDFARKPKADYTLAHKMKLTSDSAVQDTYHLVFMAQDKPLPYKPGDVVSVSPANCDERVHQLVQRFEDALGVDKHFAIESEGEVFSLQDYLAHHIEISKISVDLIKSTGAILNDWDLLKQASNEEKSSALIDSHDLLSWFKAYPISAENLSKWLLSCAPKSPRFYSVASDTDEEQLHLCVGLTKQNFPLNDNEIRLENGLGSGFLCESLEGGETVEFELESHPNFHLQTEKSMVWVATGTGIAPFIGFLAKLAQVFPTERPKVTLYFGVRNPAQDYLYETFLQNCHEEGLIDLKMAFSRIESGVYVQNLMQDNLELISSEIKSGAHVYVCGGTAMYDEVENVLQHAVLSGCADMDEAKQQWLQFSSNRLHKDIY